MRIFRIYYQHIRLSTTIRNLAFVNDNNNNIIQRELGSSSYTHIYVDKFSEKCVYRQMQLHKTQWAQTPSKRCFQPKVRKISFCYKTEKHTNTLNFCLVIHFIWSKICARNCCLSPNWMWRLNMNNVQCFHTIIIILLFRHPKQTVFSSCSM